MRVGVDASVLSMPFTGIGNYTFSLLTELVHLVPEWEFVLYSNRELLDAPDTENVIVRVDRSGWKHKGGRQWWMNMKLPRQIARDGIDVVWAPSGYLPIAKISAPTVLTVYDFVVRRFPETMSGSTKLLRYLVEGPSIRRATRLHTISEAVSDELTRFYGKSAAQVILPAAGSIYRKADDCAVREVKRKYDLPDDFFMVVGTLEPRKNLEQLFAAIRELVDRRPEIKNELVVAVVGGKGWQDREIWKNIAQLQESGVVRLLGYVPTDDLPKLYSGARALCMPSIYEGFGMPILEARMCGCPVICSDVPAMREAGGKTTVYHQPTREAIGAVLEQVLDGNLELQTDEGRDVDWSWRSGAVNLARLLRDASGTDKY